MGEKKTSYSIEEFKEAFKTGQLGYDGTRFITPKQLPGFEKVVSGKKYKRRIPLAMEDIHIIANMKRYEAEGKIYIPYNVPSSKNSQRIIRNKDGKPLLIKSVQSVEYEALSFKWWKYQRKLFLEFIEGKEFPLTIGWYYIRSSKHIFDYNNASQFPKDLMTKYGWWSDDNMKVVKSIDDGYEVDKPNRGLVLTIY